LKEITIPDTVKNLGEGAFHNCKALENVNLSKNIKEIPQLLIKQNGQKKRKQKKMQKPNKLGVYWHFQVPKDWNGSFVPN